MMRYMKLSLALLAMFLLVSCAPTLIPVPVSEGTANVKARSLTLSKGNITMIVYADAWKSDPIEVRDNFTPFYLTVQNGTGKDILINEDSILMYDENNTQYGVVKAEAVDRAVSSYYSYPPVVFYGGGYPWWGGWGWGGFGWGGGIGFYGDYPYGGRYSSDVIPMSYRFGPVTAGARTAGFIYLQNLPSSAREVTLTITPLLSTGKGITFTFPFIVEQ